MSVAPPWAASPHEVATSVATDLRRGLDPAEARRRLAADGPNELEATPPTPWWRRALRQLGEPLVLLLLAAIAVSVAVWWRDGSDGAPLDAIVIGAIVVLNTAIGLWQELKADAAVAALGRLSALHTDVVRGGAVARTPAADLVVGDVIALAEGDAIAADCRVIEAATLLVSEAPLTGESHAVDKDVAAVSGDAPAAGRTSMLHAGTAVVRGRGRAVVVATGMNTEIGRIARLLDSSASPPTPLQREIAWLGRRLGLGVVALAALTVAIVVAASADRTGSSTLDALLVGVSLAVAAVPEGLPAIMSVVLALGVQRMAADRAIVKRLASVETLGAATVICTDKTGTLTRNEMTVVRIVTAAGAIDLTGVGYRPVGDPVDAGRLVTDGTLLRDAALVVSAGSLANDATLDEKAGGWTTRGDPTEIAFLVAEEKLGAAERRRRRFSRVAEIPFASERRRMTTAHVDGDDPGSAIVVVKGAPDVVLERCSFERRAGTTVALDPPRRREIAEATDELADRALRTLAVAYRRIDAQRAVAIGDDDECDLIHLGLVGILDPPRDEAVTAVRDATRAGVRVVMITGDHPRTASRIAEALGIPDADRGSVTGAELQTLDETAFAAVVRDRSVFARVEPEQKLRIVESLQADGHVVAMTGDGVNDAPALHRADIGVAMGGIGTEVAREAADMILADDNFATILRAVREGREIFADIRKVVRYLLASNTGEVLAVLVGVLAAASLGLRSEGTTALPLLATQILWINLLTDGAMAVALGVDPAVDDVLARGPRRHDERLVDGPMLLTIGLLGVTAAVAALMALDLGSAGGLLGGNGTIEAGRTMAFTTLVLAQIANAFNARSDTTSAAVRPFENRWLWASIGATIALQIAVVHVPFLHEPFGTTPLGVTEWLWCVALASSVLWVDEARKWFVRNRQIAVR